MDNDKMDEILKNTDIPTPSENARKAALNMAMAEFKSQQNKKIQKTSQGFPFLSRLMGISNQNNGRDPMSKKTNKTFIYGGMATALAVILTVGIGVQQSPQMMDSSNDAVTTAVKTEATNFSSVSSNLAVSNTPGLNLRVLQPKSKPEKSDAPVEYEMAEVEMDAMAPNVQAVQVAPAPQALSMSKMQMRSKGAPTGMLAESYIAPAPIVHDDIYMPPVVDQNRDKFESVKSNPIKTVADEPVSTFSSDVDTASYSVVRASLNRGQMPNPDAVRIEEMVNYFDYNYTTADSLNQPFKPTVTITDSPWNAGKKLINIGIKGYDLKDEKPKSNLVFLLDVSGSMNQQNKLPLLKQSLKLLLENMDEKDTISIAVYAGAAGTVLEPTPASEKQKIMSAIDNLRAGGSTAGEAGIKLAYSLAEQNFDKDAVNRIILATDGDFNVGTANTDELKKLVEKKRKSGVFLSVFGFGMGNYQDNIMQTLAQNGNGVAAYIDNLNEARKVLVEEATSTLFPIAKDVKFQVEFNPARVAEYRLVGYETRHLNREDFNNDKIDAGDIGAGHTVTAIYEIAEFGSESISVDPLRYGDEAAKKKPAVKVDPNAEYAFLKIRHKKPDADKSNLMTLPITNAMEGTNQDATFSAAVAGFAQKLKGAEHVTITYDDIIEAAQSSKGDDPFGYRTEFIQLVRMAKSIDK